MDNAKNRYSIAHLNDFKERYPSAYKDGHYCEPKYPQVAKANGLTQYIVNFINWNGYNATRINVMGRMVGGVEKQESGVRLRTNKFIPSSTRKGTADITATIQGRSVKIEIKAGKDKPRPDQLLEQARERRAGGIYEFISTPEEFLKLFDQILGLFGN